MSRMTEPHVAMTAKQQSFISTNITIVVIHYIQNCRIMLVSYVLHSHDIIMEWYAYKNAGWKRITYLGILPDLLSKVPPSWMTDQVKLRCHGQINKLLSPSLVHYKSDFVWTDRLYPLNAPRQRPDITRNKIWNQLINNNVFRKTAQMKQLYRRQTTAVTLPPQQKIKAMRYVRWPPRPYISHSISRHHLISCCHLMTGW